MTKPSGRFGVAFWLWADEEQAFYGSGFCREECGTSWERTSWKND